MDNIGRLIENLQDAGAKIKSLGAQAIGLTLSSLQHIVEVYPPQPARDRAKTFNTYVRGVGNYPRSSFQANKKEPGGYKVKLTRKGQIRMTSQQMDKRFKQLVKQDEHGVTGTLWNDATYSGWVLGSSDQGADPHQVPWHAETGWTDEETGLEKVIPELNENIEHAIDKFWESI